MSCSRLSRTSAAVLCMLLWSWRADAATVWFEVAAADPRTPQSWLLPVSDPQQVAQARARLAGGASSGVGAIVVARFRAGGDGLNRNLRTADARRWSWHATELVEFADLAIELCDGSPQLVEDAPQAFADNTGGIVCFWGYRLVAELPSPPRIALTDALDGFWHDPSAPGTGLFVDVFEPLHKLGVGRLDFVDEGRAQRWRVGVGDIDGDAVVSVPLLVPSLPADGDAALREEGAIVLDFIDCNRATMHAIDDHGHPRTIDLVRTVQSFACGPR